jgi:hypothetical protein
MRKKLLGEKADGETKPAQLKSDYDKLNTQSGFLQSQVDRS